MRTERQSEQVLQRELALAPGPQVGQMGRLALAPVLAWREMAAALARVPAV